MRERSIGASAICLVLIIALALGGCSSVSEKGLSEQIFEQRIQEKLDNITNPKDRNVSLSSNPYDYIAASNEDYKYIVSQAKKSFIYMTNKFANSDTNGLEEYIMAIACSEILNEEADSKNWSSGREWYENYVKLNNNN